MSNSRGKDAILIAFYVPHSRGIDATVTAVLLYDSRYIGISVVVSYNLYALAARLDSKSSRYIIREVFPSVRKI